MENQEVVSVNISTDKGTVKNAIDTCYVIENFGLENDAHSSNKTLRQVSLLASESYEKDFSKHAYGSFGENITTKGITLHTLPIGTILNIDECVLEITQIGKKCHSACDISKEIGTCVMPTHGIFCKVLKSGTIKSGSIIKI